MYVLSVVEITEPRLYNSAYVDVFKRKDVNVLTDNFKVV